MRLIGDPHLGRKFQTGVPLHRRGEREALQLKQFVEELRAPDELNICVGDLFDHPFVAFSVVLDAARAYHEAAAASPSTTFVVLAGNHDIPRNTETVGAFDIFSALMAPLKNVVVLTKPAVIDEVALFPWEWTRTAEEQVADVQGQKFHTVVGHWDLESFGGDDSHICPTHLFDNDVNIYSGHYHLAGDYVVGGRTVHCTGSMQPYTHAEDPEGKMYVTLTLDEALARDDLSEKCVRILLNKGQELPTDLDCLALTAKRVSEDVAPEDLNIEGFNWSNILTEKMADVPTHVVEFIEDKLKEFSHEDH